MKTFLVRASLRSRNVRYCHIVNGQSYLSYYIQPCPHLTTGSDCKWQSTQQNCPPSSAFSSTAQIDQIDGFLAHWRELISNGRLRPDKAQDRVAKRLHRLQQALVGYSNEPFFVHYDDRRKQIQAQENEGGNATKIKATTLDGSESTATDKSDANDELSTQKPTILDLPHLPRIPRGLYIHGHVGSGKSLLMDTFYASIDSVPDHRKARYHFHAFMQDIHARIHQLKQDDLKTQGRNFHVDTTKDHNPIVRVALQLSRDTTLICLDEFQVTDVADALIMSQLFEVLFTFGTILIATSNRPPQDLYEGGLNRSYFEPFIGILEQHCAVHSLTSESGDYRQVLSSSVVLDGVLNQGKNFFLTEGSDVDDVVTELLDHVYSNTSVTVTNETILECFDLSIGFGRTLTVSASDPDGLVGVFSFEELCHGDLGAADYRAIAQKFAVIALRDVPLLSTFQHNRARRFITLVDELYEGRCALVCTTHDAVEGPVNLFPSAGSNGNNDTASSVEVSETLGLEDVQTQGGQPVSTLASVRELSFAFKRAASRITEMTSQRWWKQVLQQRQKL